MKRQIVQFVAEFRELRRARRRRFGGSLIELILVLPVLLSLTFGVAEYGYYFYVKNTLLGAARNGVRQGILSTASNTTAKAAVDSTMSAAGLQNSGYTISYSPSSLSNVSSGTMVTITVSVNWGTVGVHVLPSWLGGISNSKTVIGTASMNRE